KMKTQKGFVQIPILIIIIAGVLILGETGYFGIKQYQNYQSEKIQKERMAQEMAREKEKQTEEEKKKQESEVAKLKEEMEALKNKKPETITQTIIKEVPSPSVDISTIINQWKKYIGVVYCQYFVDGKYITPQFGSGVLTKMKFKISPNFCEVGIQTNRHVVLLNGNILPISCKVQLQDSANTYEFLWKDGNIGASYTHDASRLDFTVVDQKNCATADSYINNLVSGIGKRCNRIPQLGEAVIILGYPVTGSANGITATEGIISGYDGNFSGNGKSFYITSAKIEHGNSGGAAILLKDNCYLGIPTFAKVGEVESMGRILEMSDINNIME
ncbi:MAG: serine protease, partial [Candidatus Parcubacteria bacterium]|nr:serine protease [Candidatus Parcubacteria bacterium]